MGTPSESFKLLNKRYAITLISSAPHQLYGKDTSAIECAANTIFHDQNDLSNELPRLRVEATKTTAQTAATSFTKQENYPTTILLGAKHCLSERIRCLCKCWTELEGLPSNESLKRYIHALFCNTVRMTLSKEWDNATSWDCENLRNALFRMNSRACQSLAALLPSPWGDETVLKVIHGNFVPSALEDAYEISRAEHENACVHTCTDICLREPRSVPRTRVELLCYAGLKHEALRLCLYYHNCPVLLEDTFYGLTAFHLLYAIGGIKHLIDEVDNLTCHDGFHLVQLILLEHDNVHPLAECLLQVLLVRDFVGPSHYCCTLALLELWCSLHVKLRTSLDDLEREVQKLGSLATKSAHLYLLVDVLYKQYGRHLLPLYLNLYVHALTIDFNNLEYARQVDCRVAVAELETHMSGIYTKMGSLLAAEEDQGLARECELTAFSLEPTIERLTKLRMYAMSYPVEWSYHHVVRLVPCSGECHCSEKGLCRRDSSVPPWFMTHVPSGILDSNLKGVSKQLLQDLCILVEGPRCRWLTWNMPWRNLDELCMHYLTTAREFRASTDDRRVGIEARLKRLGPFDSSTIPVFKKDHASFTDANLQECMLEQNEKRSTTENYNEIDTSTVQDEMQINVSGTSEMKTESSEIARNAPSGESDASEICEPPLLYATNNMIHCTDLTPIPKQTDNVQKSTGCTRNNLASSNSDHSAYRTGEVQKVELTVEPEDDILRFGLIDKNGRGDLGMVEMTHNMQHNGSHLARNPYVPNQADLSVIKDCNALTASVTSLLNEQCDQHEFSATSSLPPQHQPKHYLPNVSPSKTAIVDALHTHLSNKEITGETCAGPVHPFSTSPSTKESRCLETLASTTQPFFSDSELLMVHASVPELVNSPQPTNEASFSKTVCAESHQALSNTDNLQAPEGTSTQLSTGQVPLIQTNPSVVNFNRECLVDDILDVRLKNSTEQMGVPPPSINLESLIAETLFYTPKTSYEDVLVSDASTSLVSPLHPHPNQTVISAVTVASSTLNTECSSVVTTTGSIPAAHCSASLMDHLYGKNMIQPFFGEYLPVAYPTVQGTAQDSDSPSPMSTYTTTRNISTSIPSYAQPHVGTTTTINTGASLSAAFDSKNRHQVTITEPSGNVAFERQCVVSHAEAGVNILKMDPQIGFDSFTQPTSSAPPNVSESIRLSESCSNTPIQLMLGTQSPFAISATTSGSLYPSLLANATKDGVATKSNPAQAFFNADVVSSQQFLQCVIPKMSPLQPEQLGQTALQPPSRIASTLSQQPVQAYILQPKMVHVNTSLQLPPVDLMRTQQVVNTSASLQPVNSGEAPAVFNFAKAPTVCAPTAFHSSTSLVKNPTTALQSQTCTNPSIVRPLDRQQTQASQNVILASARASALVQPTSQNMSQTCATARVPALRIQCPDAKASIPQYKVLSPSPKPTVSFSPKSNHGQARALHKQASSFMNARSIEIQPGQKPQHVSTVPDLLERANQSVSETFVSTLPLPTRSSDLQLPHKSLHSSSAISSHQESSTIAQQPNLLSPLKSRLQMYTPSRLQTRKPFNKPRTDGKPRWTTSYSSHGKMCHHINGKEKEAIGLRGSENASANLISSSSPLKNPTANVQHSIFKRENATLSCASLTSPTAISRCSTTTSSLTSNVAGTNSKMTACGMNTTPVSELVSSDVTGSLCNQTMPTAKEQTTIKPLTNSCRISKVSLNMVMPPDLTHCNNVGRVSSTTNLRALLPATTRADIRSVQAAPNGKIAEFAGLASNSSAGTVSAPMPANTNRTSNCSITTGVTSNFRGSCTGINARSVPTITSSSKISPSTTVRSPCLENATKSNTSVTLAEATTVSTPPVKSGLCAGAAPGAAKISPSSAGSNYCTGSVYKVKVPAQSCTSSSSVGVVSTGIIRYPTGANCASILSAALTSNPTVVLNKLNLNARNFPIVKKCISPAILSKPKPISSGTHMLSSVTTTSKIPLSSQSVGTPSRQGILPSEPQSQKCHLSQSTTKEVFRRKDLGQIRVTSNENSSECSNEFGNLKVGPSIQAKASLSKTHLEMSMEKGVFKLSSPGKSSPSKQVIDSPPSSSQPYNLMAKQHDEPLKCVCPICHKVLMRKSLRSHVTNIHKDFRNIEFEESKIMSDIRQDLIDNAVVVDKTNSALSKVDECNTNVLAEETPGVVKETKIPRDTSSDQCMSDSPVKNYVCMKDEQSMHCLDLKSASDASIRELSTDSKSSNDDKSTNSTSSSESSSPKSQNDTGMDCNRMSLKREHSTATTSGDTEENNGARGRVSSRNSNKPGQKRSCLCCENISPNSSAKKCRNDKLTRSATSPKKSTHSKMPRKMRSNGCSDKSL